MSVLIETKDISYRYPNGPLALRNVSVSIKEGARIAIAGQNGAGKSTLLQMLNGMLRPDSGEVLFEGKELAYERKKLRELRRRVGFVFQNPDVQILAPTVYQDVAFGPVNLGYSDSEVRTAVSEALHYVGLSGYERRPPHNLSGGEKKRAAIAGVLAMDPDVLVFDEPTSSLDPAGAEEIMDLLDEMHENGKTIIISTHDVELVYPWADTVILMGDGSVLKQGTPEEVFINDKQLRFAKLRMPALLEIYSGLVARGMQGAGAPPKSALDLIHLLERDRHGEMQCDRCGSIYLADVGAISEGDLSEFMHKDLVSSVGAMGSKAKFLAEKESLELDFTYGVIDKCILKAMNGRDSLILTSGGMVSRVHERVQAFGEESGRHVGIISCCPEKSSQAVERGLEGVESGVWEDS